MQYLLENYNKEKYLNKIYKNTLKKYFIPTQIYKYLPFLFLNNNYLEIRHFSQFYELPHNVFLDFLY